MEVVKYLARLESQTGPSRPYSSSGTSQIGRSRPLIEDRPSPAQMTFGARWQTCSVAVARGGAGLQPSRKARTMSLSALVSRRGPPPEHSWLRAATGRKIPVLTEQYRGKDLRCDPEARSTLEFPPMNVSPVRILRTVRSARSGG